MNELMKFDYENQEVRTIIKDGEPWFIGKDVADILGYERTDNAIRSHVDDEDKLTHRISASGQSRNMKIINESGLYSLILSSKLPTAKQFKRWVTSDVLPSIRKTGGYRTKPMTEYQQLMAKTRAENIKIRKAQVLTNLSKKYENTTYSQVLDSYATKELTGEHILPLPELEEKTYSATEIGEIVGISSNKVGRIAKNNNLKTDEYGKWFHDKSRHSNKEVSTFRYFESVIPIIRELM